MKKNIAWILISAGIICLSVAFAQISHAGYAFPQNYTTDQRRFDVQQANNLVMRRLQNSYTDQWAIGVVNLDSFSGPSISTASYGVINSTNSTTIAPTYSVKRVSMISIGGLATYISNHSDGTLYLDDGMSYDQSFDNAISSFTFTVNLSTGVFYYAITVVK